MKRFIAFLLVVCLSFCLGACTSSPVAAGNVIEGNQEEFLKDMAAGINDRIRNDRNTAEMTDEQIIKLYTKLVNCELKKIEKYENQTFSDTRFNDLAHLYIDGCQMQLKACEYYKDMGLYNALWSSGYNARCAIITTLYENYNLPISSETASNYNLNTTPNIAIDNNGTSNSTINSNLDDSKIIPNSNITKEKAEFGFLNHEKFADYLTNGVFRCGTDFKPGTYYVMSLYQAGANIKPSEDPSDFKWSGYRNINILNLKKNQYIKIQNGQIMVSEDLVNSFAWEDFGMLKVGKDLLPGDYRIERITNTYHTDLAFLMGVGGSVQIFNKYPTDTDVQTEICVGDEQKYVTLKDGQSIMGVNIRIEKVS